MSHGDGGQESVLSFVLMLSWEESQRNGAWVKMIPSEINALSLACVVVCDRNNQAIYLNISEKQL